ncbi:MAG TPA: efflux RND transporter periplasmic adaptor subunit [Azospirillaceae bacterium]|nr:efflux RND transporter periplasmic adaptor subunit [Azospirillaceae bacterium]
MRLAWQIVTVAGLVLVGGGAWYAASGGAKAPGPGGPGGPGRATQVVATSAGRGDIAVTFDAVGTLRANEAVTVTAKQSGIVRAIHFEEGQLVQAGAVLVEMDDSEARANLAVAESNVRNTRQLLDRSRELLKRQAVAQARVDELTTQIEGQQASVRAAQARLQDLTIRAPFAGMTGLRQVSPGALVTPGREVTTIDDVSIVKLEFAVPEIALRSLSAGMKITASSAAYPGESFDGAVEVVDTRVDPVTRTVKVVARLANQTLKLKPGMFMSVQLPVENRTNVVLVPEEALVPVGDQQFAFVAVNNKVQRRALRIGARQSGMVEVVEGLKDGDLVITRGTQKVRDGAPVQVEVAPQTALPRPATES